MTSVDLLRQIERFVGKVNEDDLEDMVFKIRTTLGVQEVDCVVGDCDITFSDYDDATITVELDDIVGARWVASGTISDGTLGGTY